MAKRSRRVTQQEKHAKRRAYERYSVCATKETLSKLRDKILRSEGTRTRVINRRLSIWILSYEDLTLRVVYDNRTKCVVTFLPIYDNKGREVQKRYEWDGITKSPVEQSEQEMEQG